MCVIFSGDHTETVDIEYDPDRTNYDELLDLFWKNHNPTSFSSRQYMSAIFYHSKEQQEKAEASMKEEQARRAQKIETRIMKAEFFYNAEELVFYLYISVAIAISVDSSSLPATYKIFSQSCFMF